LSGLGLQGLRLAKTAGSAPGTHVQDAKL